MIGHVDGGTMRIRPPSPSRVRRPPPRRGACTATASPPSVRHRLHASLGSARRRLVGRGAGSLTARGRHVSGRRGHRRRDSLVHQSIVRRATLVVLRAGQRPAVLRQAHFDEVLAEMNAEHQSLTPVAARRRRRPRGCTLAGHHPADKQVTAQAGSRHELAEKRRRDPRRPARPRAHRPRADSPDRHAWLARAQPCPGVPNGGSTRGCTALADHALRPVADADALAVPCRTSGPCGWQPAQGHRRPQPRGATTLSGKQMTPPRPRRPGGSCSTTLVTAGAWGVICGQVVALDVHSSHPERRSDDGQTILKAALGARDRGLTWENLWSYGDSNPGPLACHQQAVRPLASIPAGHRPGASTKIRLRPGRLRYFHAVPLSQLPQ